MDTQRIARLTPLADVLARIDALAAPRRLAPVPGRVLAADAVAAAAVPAVARALRDGFAVAADALYDASAYVPVPPRGNGTIRWLIESVPELIPDGRMTMVAAAIVTSRRNLCMACA